jgi:hypothetical protein
VTLKDLTDFIDDKQNLLGGFAFTKDYIRELSKNEDFDIIYEQGDSMIVEVYSGYGIKAIGCNSLWCFTYGEDMSIYWDQYNYNGIVYTLIDFSLPSDIPEFMYVLIEPLINEDGEFYDFEYGVDTPLFDMSNQRVYDPYSVLLDLFGKDYKKIVRKYLNFQE